MAARIAIVTGAASGIGEAIARRLAEDGATVAVVDRDEHGRTVADEIGGSFVPGDLADRATCRGLVDDVVTRHGGVDVLVNCAGIQHVAPVEEFDEERWDTIIALMR